MAENLHDPADRWLSRRRAAAYLSIGPSTFDQLVRGGKVHKFKIDGLATPLFDREQLDALVRPVDGGSG